MKSLIKKKVLKENGFLMLTYKNRIVFTGGTGRFATNFLNLNKIKQNLIFIFQKKVN